MRHDRVICMRQSLADHPKLAYATLGSRDLTSQPGRRLWGSCFLWHAVHLLFKHTVKSCRGARIKRQFSDSKWKRSPSPSRKDPAELPPVYNIKPPQPVSSNTTTPSHPAIT